MNLHNCPPGCTIPPFDPLPPCPWCGPWCGVESPGCTAPPCPSCTREVAATSSALAAHLGIGLAGDLAPVFGRRAAVHVREGRPVLARLSARAAARCYRSTLARCRSCGFEAQPCLGWDGDLCPACQPCEPIIHLGPRPCLECGRLDCPEPIGTVYEVTA